MPEAGLGLHVKRVNAVTTYCGRDVRHAGSSAIPLLAAGEKGPVCHECLQNPELASVWPTLVEAVRGYLGA